MIRIYKSFTKNKEIQGKIEKAINRRLSEILSYFIPVNHKESLWMAFHISDFFPRNYMEDYVETYIELKRIVDNNNIEELSDVMCYILLKVIKYCIRENEPGLDIDPFNKYMIDGELNYDTMEKLEDLISFPDLIFDNYNFVDLDPGFI